MDTEQSERQGEHEPVPQITADDAGTWLDGSQGWHNTYRVAERAMEYGWKPEDPEGLAKTTEAFKAGDDDIDVAVTMDYVAEDATQYLQSRAPKGHYFEWDAGELSLVKADEGLTEPAKDNRGDREPGELPGPQ